MIADSPSLGAMLFTAFATHLSPDFTDGASEKYQKKMCRIEQSTALCDGSNPFARPVRAVREFLASWCQCYIGSDGLNLAIRSGEGAPFYGL